MPLALATESRAAILNGESAILCEKAGMTSKHSTVQFDPSVTSSDRGYIRRTPAGVSLMKKFLFQYPDLPDLQRSQQQQPSGNSQLSPVEKEAIRWKGKPWLAPSPVRPPRGRRGISFGLLFVASTIPKGLPRISLSHPSSLASCQFHRPNSRPGVAAVLVCSCCSCLKANQSSVLVSVLLL